MKAIAIGASMALATTAQGAAEENYSANYWLPYCKEIVLKRPLDEGRFGSSMFCAGVVLGVVWSSQGSKEAGRCISPPNDVTREQTVRVVVRYIEARPQRMHERFEALALEALRNAWPCK